MSDLKIIKVKCPSCKKENVYSTDNSFRPFCSEKCQLIDLGQWFGEEYSFGGDEVIIDDERCE